MLRKFLLLILLVTAGFAAYVAMLPPEGRVTREAILAARPDVLFPLVNDFHKWDLWSPWAKLDPKAKSTHSGAEQGVGSVFAWDGNSDVGTGKMTILESVPSERIRIQLDFEKPMAGTQIAEFTFKPEGDSTRVNWDMRGEAGFFERAICLLLNMDRMVGGQFEQGLKNLEAAAAGKER